MRTSRFALLWIMLLIQCCNARPRSPRPAFLAPVPARSGVRSDRLGDPQKALGVACINPASAHIAFGASGLPLKGVKPAFNQASADYLKSRFPGAELREVDIRCGRCIGCRKAHSTFWGIRCYHEWRWYHDRRLPVVMATLTYADEHLPPHGDLQYSDVQGFWMRLRRHIRYREEKAAKAEGREPDFSSCELRYVVAGEYGPQTARPHWHALIFGVKPDDLEWFKRGSKGHPNHDSPSWSKCWGKGITTFDLVDDVKQSFYVSGYAMKSAGLLMSGQFHVEEEWMVPPGAKRKRGFYLMTVNGERVQRQQEYSRVSQDPPIGYRWFQEFYRDVFPHDRVMIFDREWPVPPAYFEWLAEIDPDMAVAVAHKRQARFSDPREIERREIELSAERVQAYIDCSVASLKRSGHVSE